MKWIARYRKSDGAIQTIEDHLLNVKELAESIGKKIGVKHLTGLAGMLHDLGKCTNEFQQYINAAIKQTDAPPKRGSVDHSTAGGKLLYEMYHTGKESPYHTIVAEIVGNAIISHHSYLQDFLSPHLQSPFLNRTRDKILAEYDVAKRYFFSQVMNEANFRAYVDRAAEELKTFLSGETPNHFPKRLMFLTKYIFSALIDADWTDARLFDEGKRYVANDHRELFAEYYEKLKEQIELFKCDEGARHPINALRQNLSEQCEQFAEKPSGVYTLSIPTGGGKTLASLRYALKHALVHDKQRIVYVVPYTTIIEQNAAAVRQVLEDEFNILEHHSNVIDDRDEDDEAEIGAANERRKWKLAEDPWDAPIIFTTMVQFLNVFYEKGSRNIRRLHNLSNSVIIFDEVQKVPIHCVSLFNQALNFLKNKAKSCLVLCTATQPALDFVEHQLELSAEAEMVQRLDEVIHKFKRVDFVDMATKEPFENEQLADFIEKQLDDRDSMLIILNTKSVARDLYHRLMDKQTGAAVYHLSASMCAAHRQRVLEEVKERLQQKKKTICVSTQLIEAGVDISFECVVRSLTGLDSIAQAAGRCNRHGENQMGTVYIIDHKQENLRHLKEIRIGKQVSRKILIDMSRDETAYGGYLLSKQAMDAYFHRFFTEMKTDLNYFIPSLEIDMIELLISSRGEGTLAKAYRSKHGNLPPLFLVGSYYAAAEHFQAIEENTTTVLVPYGKGKEIIAEFNGAGSIEDCAKLLRRSQPYSVQLYQQEIDQLAQKGGLVELLDGKIIALKEGAYDKKCGVSVDRDSSLDFIFI